MWLLHLPTGTIVNASRQKYLDVTVTSLSAHNIHGCPKDPHFVNCIGCPFAINTIKCYEPENDFGVTLEKDTFEPIEYNTYSGD